jgi:hypothetical protein
VTSHLGGGSIFGNNATGNDDVDATCVNGTSEEEVYTVTPAFTDDLYISLAMLGTTYDTGLSVREGSCAGTEVACDDDTVGALSPPGLLWRYRRYCSRACRSLPCRR